MARYFLFFLYVHTKARYQLVPPAIYANWFQNNRNSGQGLKIQIVQMYVHHQPAHLYFFSLQHLQFFLPASSALSSLSYV